MSHQLISRSTDLKQLRDEGYEVEVRGNYLLVHSVPYVNGQRQVAFGSLVSELTLAGDVTVRPNTHVVHFIGDHPRSKDGTPIVQIAHASTTQQLLPGLVIHHSFSNKPAGGYANYYEKMTRYVDVISSAAKALDQTVDARTFKPIESSNEESVFRYIDTASSRAGIGMISGRVAGQRIAIVGVGGSGSYILDFIAKTPVKEIHLFDDDLYLQHNAFRSPGAALLDDLRRQVKKVDYFAEVYGRMRYGVVPHSIRLDDINVHVLNGFDFVFVCVDRGSVRKVVLNALRARRTPFVDVGMGVEVTPNDQLFAVCRTTAGTSEKTTHIDSRVPLADMEDDGVYSQNIQIAELNALNAAFAVIKWKKIAGIYEDIDHEHHSTYSTNFQLLTSEEKTA
ncbi:MULTISPECIES: ThiF family adenylyltransferase [Acidobacterium]|uniref:ThiF domain protein n=1 Tax=Acidobacterium capsulatum (strain ATCC 51196 / DSM 11244 / BCRC 80197 / JCM 7670 / NBRC 15755 / NCIMB 13165 / 161) TaxID=240015 RepID=C1F6N4_ACIC5|nr:MULTISPECIES: ThiF family adenylyltransferase [Acidobacterium]ACO33621.1 ThiF domain protein [Acidobacterium capsulatum ATCC 51196]HCT60926.1 ThiF family adenylyltransferase [Acidobacterium sp.]